jgi:zinc protease
MTATLNRIARAALAGLAATILWCAPAPAADLDPRFDPSKLAIPPLNSFAKVTPERVVLRNGLVLFLLEDHTLPVVQSSAYFRASGAWVPADRVGLGGLTATVMRSGGSAAKPGDWLDDRLAAIGATLYSNLGADYASSGFWCLSENAPEVLGLFAEVLRRPAFPDDKIELAKVGLRRSIASRNDEMQSILFRVARQSAYGKDSPWARQPEYATVEPITRDDCVMMHRLVYAPNRFVLVVYGDFKSPAMKKLVQAAFGDWPRNDEPTPPVPGVPASTARRVVFAPKDDVTQSGVIVTQLGYKADDPDNATMDVVEQALGGGFSSRLFNVIRTQRGLAYAAGASAGGGYFRPGVFMAYSLTRNDSAMVATDLLRSEVERVTKEPFSDEEAKLAREAVENSLVFQFSDRASVVFRAGFYELAGYPQDFLQRYQKALGDVTPATMLGAAQRKIHPDQFVTVIVGKEKEFDRPLDAMGQTVERVDIAIPPPPSKVAAGEATPAQLAKGQQWLKAAADHAGGPAAWAAVKAFRQTGNATLTMQGQSMAVGTETALRFPDRVLEVLKLPQGEMSMGFDGAHGWRKGFGQIMDQPEMAQEVKADWERSLFRLFGHAGEYRVQALDAPRTVDGVAYRVAVIRSEVVRDWQLYFAPDGTLARMEFMDDGPAGPATHTLVYGDWRAVGGLQYPFSNKVMIAGEPYLDTKIVEAVADPTLGDELFAKPAN